MTFYGIHKGPPLCEEFCLRPWREWSFHTLTLTYFPSDCRQIGYLVVVVYMDCTSAQDENKYRNCTISTQTIFVFPLNIRRAVSGKKLSTGRVFKNEFSSRQRLITNASSVASFVEGLNNSDLPWNAAIVSKDYVMHLPFRNELYKCSTSLFTIQ